ncbi:hypothetical protein WJX73_009525 [Symbiochloris irregularis]|uniref:MaoC-like domain-containing protein n=1 Tax=Symbiochloris irregularis TaxID=706552 RepID=A0AAW1NRC7_9CHLO
MAAALTSCLRRSGGLTTVQSSFWLRWQSEGAQGSAKLLPGTVYELHKVFSQKEVTAFLDTTGDNNDFHHDSGAARLQGFKGAIMPGMLCASLFPALVAQNHPGAVYASQELKFVKPVLVGEDVYAKVEHDGKRRQTQ